MSSFPKKFIVATAAAGDASAVKLDKDKVKGKEKDKEKDKEKEKEKETEKENDKQTEKVKEKDKRTDHDVLDEIPERTRSELERYHADLRALERQNRFKRRWPSVTKVKIITKPWHPPPPPQKQPPIEIELPALTTRRWVPPYRRRRRARPRRMRVPLEEISQPLYECSKLNKIWHNFNQVEKNKMILQGNIAADSKRYSASACGSQTACIAVVCRALLDEKPASQLVRSDVDDCINTGNEFYKLCLIAMKCYKGKPQLELNQLTPSFFLHDTKYTVKMLELESGFLAKHPDNIQDKTDLMSMMEKRVGQTYSMILSIDGKQHFLLWGHPPEGGGSVKTIAYIFDPNMLDETGRKNRVRGAGAFMRYAGITSFVLDFLANYADLESAKKGTPRPPITLTSIEVVQKEPLLRVPTYELDLKALKVHCQSEWESLHRNKLLSKKIYEGEYPLCSLSAVSLATSRGKTRKKVKDFYNINSKEPLPTLPIPPERPPPALTNDQIMEMRGEDFFLYCPRTDGHAYGRDDNMVPPPKEEVILHSYVDISDKNYNSQYQQLDAEKWFLRGTRHFASYRYQTFKNYTGVACCLSALGLLKRLRARAWNEDTVDETLDLGYNLYRESLGERGGPVRRLVLGEMKESFKIRDQEFVHKDHGIAVWGKMVSSKPKVFDLCRGLDHFFKESDSGIFQIPGVFEAAIWNEGGKYYLYHPWPADRYGKLLGLRDGGKACIMYFTRIPHMCDHMMESLAEYTRRPFSISDVKVFKRNEIPQPLNNLTPVAPGRWVVRGHFHEGDERFPEDHRNKQATPMAIVALALANVRETDEWTREDVDDVLTRGDILYANTMEHLERMGISLATPTAEEGGGEEEDTSTPSGTLAAADVLNRFSVTDTDFIETDVMDSAYNGSINPEPGSGVLSLKDSLKQFFASHTHGVVTARGNSHGVWKDKQYMYMFDPHPCDENGYPSDDLVATACVMRLSGGVSALADAIMGNLPAAADDTFNISPVNISAAKMNLELSAPETKLESKEYAWLQKGTAAIMMGPRGDNSAIGKCAKKAGIGEEDMAGRHLALPAAAAFTAATAAVPAHYMHQDHMFNFLDAGAEYYTQFVKKTGKKELVPEDLTQKFEMGANTFSIELDEPTRLAFWIPDETGGEGAEEGAEKELLEGEEEPIPPMKQIKEALFKVWNDYTQPAQAFILYGDYHQIGIWMSPGGKVVAFDPAPTLHKGMLTPQRIAKGDELRLQRIKDEMSGEDAGGDDEADEEAGGEGEQMPEPPAQFVPPESCPILILCSSPGELMNKLALQGGLDRKQCLAPYKLYPVKIINELTSLLKDRKSPAPAGDEENAPEETEEDQLVDPLDDEVIGQHYTRTGRTTASLRGRVAQDENYFLDAQRDLQDAANAVMGIVVEHVEPHKFWKPSLIDAILKYGDRLYTLSIPNAKNPPDLTPKEVAENFHVTNFNIRLEMDGDQVTGDLMAGESGGVLNLRRGIEKLFENAKYGVICCKNYCVGVWKASDDKAYVLWEPHSVGPMGRSSPVGGAGAIIISTVEALAETIAENIKGLGRPGGNRFSITPVKVFWEFAKAAEPVTPQGAVPDDGYEWKVLTAYVETARGRTILRGSRPPDLVKFTRDALLQSSCAAIVAACMSHVRRPHLWTRATVDEVMAVGCKLFASSLGSLGYEFRPGDDVLLPLQVLKRYVLGVNYVRFNLCQVFSGRLDQRTPSEMTARCALERFFESHTHGILWSVPHAVAVWKVQGSPAFYMMEPHACGPTGLRIDAQDDGAACVLTFTSPKLMAFAYLQNIPVTERPKHEFQLYSITVVVQPIKKLGGVEPPIVHQPRPKSGIKLLPATSKVGIDGVKRRASEKDRKHPPGSATCLDAERATLKRDKEEKKLKGQRNTSGWLVLNDGTQFLSAQHSMACRKFPYAARGKQALSCCVMAVAMSRVQDVCRWCSSTLDQILESGDQLHQDSYLHFKPDQPILSIEQILRKFYTPGNCVCRVVVYRPRHAGMVDSDLQNQLCRTFEIPHPYLVDLPQTNSLVACLMLVIGGSRVYNYIQLTEFFREEKSGVFVAGNGDFAVALFRTPRGYYMFDPADRDRYGRAVAPPCTGKARACFSQYPNVQTLVEKLGANIPPMIVEEDVEGEEPGEAVGKVSYAEPPSFEIYGMDVTSLRRLNRHEK